MRDYIAKRLTDISSSEERALLKEMLNNVFLSMHDDLEGKYAALEQRVRDELPLMYDVYTVYSAVLPRQAVDNHHAYLSPMVSGETGEIRFNANDLTEQLREGQHPVIETVFLEADYLKCRQIERGKPVLTGSFLVKSDRYQFKCLLKPAKRYAKQVEMLYNSFIQNDVPWTTLNCAYLSKFFDVCLIELSRELPGRAEISAKQIDISFGSYEPYVKRELVPVWNIDICKAKEDDFSMPALDAINYEYHFELSKLGENNGFLVDYNNEYILSSRREGDKLVLTSPQKKGLVWNLYRLRPRQDSSIDSYPYPVLSNSRQDSFSTRLMTKYMTRISTRAEMRKLMSSFEAAEYLELVDLHLAGKHLTGDTYNMNPFILDEVRDPSYLKTLALSFRARQRDFFLNWDIMSFLVSEFQATYPEFCCVGTLQ